MNNNFGLSLSIAFAGDLPDNKQAYLKKLHEIMVKIRVYADKYKGREYGFNGQNVQTKLYTSSLIADTEALGTLETVKEFYSAESISPDSGNGYDFINQHSELVTWLCDNSDIMLLIWNEHAQGDGWMVWDIMQNASRCGIPCIWLSADDPDKVYWSAESVYDKFNDDLLKSYLEKCFVRQDEQKADKTIFFVEAAGKLYNRFMNKYKAKTELQPYVEDNILGEAAYFEGDLEAENARMSMRASFIEHDSKANKLSERYRKSIYLRAILPFMATIFISIGFYIERVMGSPVKVLAGESNTAKVSAIFAIIAGIGFFCHALVNLYTFLLSKNENLKTWHDKFIYHRTIAETLRLLIHILPFGQTMGAKNLLARCENDANLNTKICSHVYDRMLLKHELGRAYDQKIARKMLSCFNELIDDQLIYHKNNSKRYETIVKKMNIYGKTLMYTGFVLVLARGLLQLALFLPPMHLSQKLDAYNIFINTDYIRSFANMLALMVPAWASYFTSKLSLCAFEDIYNKSNAMIPKLENAKKLIENVSERDYIPFDLMHSVSDEIGSVLLHEVLDWSVKLKGKKITSM